MRQTVCNLDDGQFIWMMMHISDFHHKCLSESTYVAVRLR